MDYNPNPYQSSAVPDQTTAPAAAAARRPVSTIVFGILNIAFAVMGLCGLPLAIAMMYMPQNPSVPNPVLETMHESNTYMAYYLVSIGLGFVAMAALGLGGVGLLLMRAWGRYLSIGYAVYAIFSAIAGSIANWVWVFGPMMDKMGQLPAGPEKAGVIGGMIGGLAGGCFGLIYPILLLIFMYRPNVVAALERRKPTDFAQV